MLSSYFELINRSRGERTCVLCSVPSVTAGYTPCLAFHSPWSWILWNPAWGPTGRGLWDPQVQSHRTRWDCPRGHNRTSLLRGTSRSPGNGSDKFLLIGPSRFKIRGLLPLVGASRWLSCLLSSVSWTPGAERKDRTDHSRIHHIRSRFLQRQSGGLSGLWSEGNPPLSAGKGSVMSTRAWGKCVVKACQWRGSTHLIYTAQKDK